MVREEVSSPDPRYLYVDTDVLVNFIFGGLPDSEACTSAIERVARTGSMIFTSIITRMEFAQATRALATRNQLPPRIHETFNLEQWADRQVRRTWMLHWLQEYERFLAALPVAVELSLSTEIINVGVELMARHGLRSHDAVHVATASLYEIPVFWTCDDHFQRVNELDVEIIRARDQD